MGIPLILPPMPTGPGERLLAAPVLVAFSGGLDSTVLLHLLANDAGIRMRGLRALHVHHGLHADADDWARHCQRSCDALDVELLVRRVDVRRDGGEGLEGAARTARHAAFGAALRDGEVLALAHHRDDQAETFLLRALRASAINGLGAMRPWRSFGRGWLWRPLLETSRAQIESCARQHALSWIEDPSNHDDAHDRNFLRHRVLPLLHERWPHASASFAASTTLLRADAALLADEDARTLAAIRCIDPACIDATTLATLPAPRRARVLRLWVHDLGLPPLPARGIAAIEHELLPAARDASACFRWQHAVIHRWRDLLHAEHMRPALAADYQVDWNPCTPLDLPTGDTLAVVGDIPPGTGTWTVHARHGGERIVLPGRTHSHSLKHALQQAGIPPWLRERLPLLSSADGRLQAAGDLVFSAGLDDWLRRHALQLRWQGSLPSATASA